MLLWPNGLSRKGKKQPAERRTDDHQQVLLVLKIAERYNAENHKMDLRLSDNKKVTFKRPIRTVKTVYVKDSSLRK